MTELAPIPTLEPLSATVAQYDASIIIVSFNTREVLRECLVSVLEETANLSVEILLVDNNSSDGSPEMVERDFPQVQVTRSPNNLGFGAANNVALMQARGRYFVLINSDAFFQPGALQIAIRHMDAQPDCGLAGGRLIGRDGKLQPSARAFHSPLRDFLVMTGLAAQYPKSKFFGQFDRTWADDRVAASVDWVPGAFSIIRPAALLKTGLFDPAFFLYYEEVDLCYRIKQAGFSIWYWPDISVIHIGGESSRQLKSLEVSSTAAQVVLWRMRSTFLYYRKHLGWRVNLARWLELALYKGRIFRNKSEKDPVRIARASESRTLVQIIHQAWNDTQGGRVSPPRPW